MLFNREVLAGLDLLQALYRGARTANEVATATQDSLMYTYQVCKKMKEIGAIYSTQGADGGYNMHPMVPDWTLAFYLAKFGIEFVPSPLNRGASLKVQERINPLYTSLRLRDLFTDNGTFVSLPGAS